MGSENGYLKTLVLIVTLYLQFSPIHSSRLPRAQIPMTTVVVRGKSTRNIRCRERNRTRRRQEQVHVILDHKILDDKSVDLLEKVGGRGQVLFKNQPAKYHIFKILKHKKKARGGFILECQWSPVGDILPEREPTIHPTSQKPSSIVHSSETSLDKPRRGALGEVFASSYSECVILSTEKLHGSKGLPFSGCRRSRLAETWLTQYSKTCCLARSGNREDWPAPEELCGSNSRGRKVAKKSSISLL
ncbi:hypothetical protein Micbo1qcDRAFT_178894 [Microdochium bolleyi]|uniref:Uncharacterized protein n=1 Tax=Microdochium bolleyi TaxID=196109 RepID=A0A136ISP3_9PEZI|nr:hypothetical protein Micbo1qcDRAFT_178894 [Microdochium bolleyi]